MTDSAADAAAIPSRPAFISQLALDIFAPAQDSAAHEGELDDLALVAESRRNQEAYALLYRRYANSVYRYMLVCVGNEQDAQDLMAQAFLAGLEGLHLYQGRGKFAAWLFSIAHRKVMDYYRHARKDVPLDDLTETAHPDRQPDQIAEDRSDYEQLTRAIHALAPDRAEVVRLRVFAELSIAEISEAMGRSESAVRMLLSRAIHDLRIRLCSSAAFSQVASIDGQ